MTNTDDGWNPTIRTPNGEELERSDWSEWRNGPQRPTEGPNQIVRIKCRAATRDRLRDAKQDKETYDQLLNRLLEQEQGVEP